MDASNMDVTIDHIAKDGGKLKAFANISISDELPSFLVEDVISKHLTDIGRISIIVVFCTEFFKPVADLLIVFYVFGGIAHIGYSSYKSITQIINI